MLLAALSPAFATTVQNLDSVPSAIQHPEGKQIFAEQMAGAISAKGFGELPQGLSENAWIARVAPNEDPDNLILTGAKAWAKTANISVSPVSPTIQPTPGRQRNTRITTVRKTTATGTPINYISAFFWQNQQLTPIARSEKPLNQLSEWNKTAEKESDDESVRPLAYYTKLDLAPYRIVPDTLAFGVRGGYSEAYSGGGAFYEVLELYAIKDNRIINVYSDLVYQYTDIAGEWNKDGTRQHDISESKYILKMRSAKTHGFYDLERVNLQDKSSQIFRWSESLQRYAP